MADTEQGGGWTDQSDSGSDVTVTQGTNNPTQVDTYISVKGESGHTHVATDKETGKEIGKWYQPNTPKKK